jgi:hypothetical protein
LFLAREKFGTGPIIRWDIAAQREVILENRSHRSDTAKPSLDDRWLTRTENKDSISVRPLSGGDWRLLVSDLANVYWQYVTSPDGKWIYYRTPSRPPQQTGINRIATAGGSSERVGDFPNVPNGGDLEMSPDGRQILAQTPGRLNVGNSFFDLWELENFEPPAKK